MKKEVKYARISYTTMNESHALFRLKKYADLDSEEYVYNLISYVVNARSIKSLTSTDLKVLYGLIMIPLFKNDIENGFVVGEYIAGFWLEYTTYE